MNVGLGDTQYTDAQLRQIAASRNAGISASVVANEAAGKIAAASAAQAQAQAEAAASARASAYNDGVIAAGGFHSSVPWIPIGAAIAAYFFLKGH